MSFLYISWKPVADPGFPEGGANRGGHYYSIIWLFFYKLHENEKNIGLRGGHVPRALPEYMQRWNKWMKEGMKNRIERIL